MGLREKEFIGIVLKIGAFRAPYVLGLAMLGEKSFRSLY